MAALVLWGWRLGARPITDNSAFVHLRTGIDMVGGLGIPRHDPYSFTAAGEPWTVQSWLASWTYGVAHRLGGFEAVLLEQAILMALLAGLAVALVRTGRPLPTAAGGLMVLGIGSPFWVPRPLLFGLVCFALMVTIVERDRPRWLLVPVVWVWVSTHGSFPLGLLWLVLRAAGAALDTRALPRAALRSVGWFTGGLAVASLNPLGPRLLLFPFTVLEKREVFRTIVEWRPPDLDDAAVQIAAAFGLAAAIVLIRRCRAWADLLPVAAFAVLAATAMRNIPIAGLVVAPAVGRVLGAGGRSPDGEGAAPASGSSRVNRLFALTLAAAFVLFGAAGWASGGIEAPPEDYPVGAEQWLEAHGFRDGRHRVANDEVAGGYLILRAGRRARVFVDDRFDMYPISVSRDLDQLIAGGEPARAVLARRRVDAVVWRADRPLRATLTRAGWAEPYDDGDWVVLVAPGVVATGAPMQARPAWYTSAASASSIADSS